MSVKEMPRSVSLLVVVLLLAGSAPCKIIYVDDSAVGDDNGTSWAHAHVYLQDALADALSGDEIRVAQGTYWPDLNGGNDPGDPHATFRLVDGAELYGGFPSGGTWNDRDPDTYKTILSGDIAAPGDASDNSYHVVMASACADGTIINGFVITGGNASEAPKNRGGGIYIVDSGLKIRRCTFSANTASLGGGMFNEDSTPQITDCLFTSNTVTYNGGGIYNDYSAPEITDCTFNNNQAADNGGGINTVSDSVSVITNCTFIDNSAEGGGGGLHITSSSPTLLNCTFIGNSARYGGGMHSGGSTGSPTVINCVFIENAAKVHGGAMNNGSDTTVTNCTLYGNSAPRVGGMLNINSHPIVTNCTIWGNTDEWHNSGEGSQIDGCLGCMEINYSCIQGWTGNPDPEGVGNIGDAPMFVNAKGDDCRLLAGSPCIDAGDSSAPGLFDPDIDGNPRIVGQAVDMGAYEFQDPLLHAAVVQTEQLINEVELLGLPAGIENSLVSKLENAIGSIRKGQANAAANKLQSSVNAVEAQGGKKISETDVEDLITATQTIIDLLEST